MKILGKTDEGYILQAERDEICKLLGFRSHCYMIEKMRPPTVGDEIKVADMYNQLYSIRCASEQLNDVQKTIDDISNSISRLIDTHPAFPILEDIKFGPDI